MQNSTKNSGFSMLYIILIIGLFNLIIGVIASLYIFQIKSSVKEEFSLKAFFAAEAGLEHGIYEYLQGTPLVFAPNPYVSSSTPTGLSYNVYVKDKGTYYEFTSIGRFENFSRTVEIDYEK